MNYDQNNSLIRLPVDAWTQPPHANQNYLEKEMEAFTLDKALFSTGIFTVPQEKKLKDIWRGEQSLCEYYIEKLHIAVKHEKYKLWPIIPDARCRW